MEFHDGEQLRIQAITLGTHLERFEIADVANVSLTLSATEALQLMDLINPSLEGLPCSTSRDCLIGILDFKWLLDGAARRAPGALALWQRLWVFAQSAVEARADGLELNATTPVAGGQTG